MCSCKSVRSVELEDAISLTPSSCRGRGFQESSCPAGPAILGETSGRDRHVHRRRAASIKRSRSARSPSTFTLSRRCSCPQTPGMSENTMRLESSWERLFAKWQQVPLRAVHRSTRRPPPSLGCHRGSIDLRDDPVRIEPVDVVPSVEFRLPSARRSIETDPFKLDEPSVAVTIRNGMSSAARGAGYRGRNNCPGNLILPAKPEADHD
jgi:hypothetical protein